MLDAPLAKEVAVAAEELREMPGGHTRITTKAIGKKIGKLTLLEHHLKKLPLTLQVINQVAETHDEYAIRRVERAKKHFRLLGFCPSRAYLLNRQVCGTRWPSERLLRMLSTRL